MLLPLTRDMDRGSHEPPPYARWSAALLELREALERQPAAPPGHLLDYLEGIAPAHQPGALQDLIAEHLRATWRMGRGLLLERYVELFGARFDDLAQAATLPAELIEDEYLARHALPGGDAPSLADYERRFPGRSDAIVPLRRRLLGGRYVKLRRLGLGATAEVWEARDRLGDRLVAIKQLRSEWAGQTEALRCFRREAEVTGRLDHRGIVEVHEFVQGQGAPPYLVMGLVRGRTLSELIKDYHYPRACRTRQEQRALWSGLLDAFETTCEAVAHAHSRDVLHRDLKAGNVQVEAGRGAVVLDWGLATRGGARAAEDGAGAVGTPEYMAPEQVHGHADERSDVFGLGALLHEMLTGRPLRSWANGKRPSDWRRIVLEEPLVPPRRRNPRAPRSLSSVCLEALAVDPDQRLKSAADLLREISLHRAGAAPRRRSGRLRRLGAFLEWAGLDRLP